MGALRLRSPASRLFTQPFIQVQVKENRKAPRDWPLCGEFTSNITILTQNKDSLTIWYSTPVAPAGETSAFGTTIDQETLLTMQ